MQCEDITAAIVPKKKVAAAGTSVYDFRLEIGSFQLLIVQLTSGYEDHLFVQYFCRHS